MNEIDSNIEYGYKIFTAGTQRESGRDWRRVIESIFLSLPYLCVLSGLGGENRLETNPTANIAKTD